jgi:major membrane immunogen (membrane-anchored lipoprotein)
MDKVIDKLILEWSWRCEKGYPDINNPADKKVLEKLLAEYGVSLSTFVTEKEEKEKSIIEVDTIIDLLKAKGGELTDDQKRKIFNTISKVGKGLSSTLYDKLIDKNLIEQQASIIVGYADRQHIEDKIIQSMTNPSNIFDKIGTTGNLTNILKTLSGLEEKHVNQLIGFTIGEKTRSVGRGELALITLLYDASKASTGDVQLQDGTVVEVKATDKSGAIVAPDVINRGDSKYPIGKIVSIFGEKFPDMKEIGKIKQVTWPDRLQQYFNKLQDTKEKKTFIELVHKLTKELYHDLVSVESITTFSSEEYKELVAKALAKHYLKGKNVLFISPTNIFTLLDGDTVEANIGKDLKIEGFSDALPRIAYRELKVSKEV